MRVLAGLYDPQRVQYAVDGEAAAGVRHLGSISTLIPQESEIFEATLRDNLTFGAAYSEEQIERAARLSALDAVAASLPQKWDMPLSERGSTFPGGNANGLRWRAGCSRGNAVRCYCSMSRPGHGSDRVRATARRASRHVHHRFDSSPERTDLFQSGNRHG